MFRPQKSPPPIRLPRLGQVPTYDDLRRILEQALEARGRTVELPFNPEQQQFGYMVSVLSDPNGGEPVWTLTTGDGNRVNVLFTYQTSDITLVINMIESQCFGMEIDEVITQRMIKPATDIDKQNTYEARQAGSFAYTMGTTFSNMQAAPRESASTSNGEDATLEGDLQNMPVPNLFQSVAMSKMTGRLAVKSSKSGGEIFFEEGVPVHAFAAEMQGDLAILESLTWEEGKFRFFKNERTLERTVKKRLDSLLMEGIGLLDQTKYLDSKGVGMQTYLFRKHPNLSEAEFESRVSQFVPVEMILQKQFYQSIDNMSNLFELLRRRPLAKTEWVPILFNFLHADILSISDKPPAGVRMGLLDVKSLDQSVIAGAAKLMQRQETGLLTYPMFLYFLEQEFHRYERLNVPFSIVIFEMRLKDVISGPQPLPLPLLKEAVERMEGLRRKLDLVAHFETFDYAAILPHTNTDSAGFFAQRLHELLLSPGLGPGISAGSLSLSFGVAGIPEDSTDPGQLLAQAREAQRKAAEGTVPVCLFKTINIAQST